MTDTTDSTTTPQPTLAQIIESEIKHLSDISKVYQKEINEAKTSYKKKYFHKKLKKNNEKLFEMLIALQKVPKRTDTSPSV